MLMSMLKSIQALSNYKNVLRPCLVFGLQGESFLPSSIYLRSLCVFLAANSATRKLKWFGINENGAEFGSNKFSGVYSKDYTWYGLSKIDVGTLH